MPAGPLPPNPLELLSRGSFAALLAKAQAEYDVILIDTRRSSSTPMPRRSRSAPATRCSSRARMRRASYDTERAMRDLRRERPRDRQPDERLLRSRSAEMKKRKPCSPPWRCSSGRRAPSPPRLLIPTRRSRGRSSVNASPQRRRGRELYLDPRCRGPGGLRRGERRGDRLRRDRGVLYHAVAHPRRGDPARLPHRRRGAHPGAADFADQLLPAQHVRDTGVEPFNILVLATLVSYERCAGASRCSCRRRSSGSTSCRS